MGVKAILLLHPQVFTCENCFYPVRILLASSDTNRDDMRLHFFWIVHLFPSSGSLCRVRPDWFHEKSFGWHTGSRSHASLNVLKARDGRGTAPDGPGTWLHRSLSSPESML